MKQESSVTNAADAVPLAGESKVLLTEVRELILSARQSVAQTVNSTTIVAALRRQLGWTHFKAIIALDDPLKRDFYAEMCRMEQWSTPFCRARRYE